MKVDGAEWPEDEDTEGTDNVPASFLGENVDPEDHTAIDTENGE